MSNPERQELLRNALVSISRRELSKRLRVPPSTLDEWICGKAPMLDGPMFVLLVVLNETTQRRKLFTDAANVEFQKRQKSRN